MEDNKQVGNANDVRTISLFGLQQDGKRMAKNIQDEKCPICKCPLSWHLRGEECYDENEICGRYMEAVNEYASTCDGCYELTMHDMMTMDKETQLRYCEECNKEREAKK